MSLDRCSWCDRIVDTDDAPESYLERVHPSAIGGKDFACVCVWCQEDEDRVHEWIRAHDYREEPNV